MLNGTNGNQFPFTGVFGDGIYFDGFGTAKVSQASIGLGNVNNTSDINKPVSTAQQTALDEKADLSDFTLLQALVDTKANTNHTHVINDTTGLQTALDNKAAANHTHSYNALTDLPDIPVLKQEYVTNLTTDSSGLLTWAFPASFTTNPNVQVTVNNNGTGFWSAWVTATTTTNVSIKTGRLESVLGLLQFSANPQTEVLLRAVEP